MSFQDSSHSMNAKHSVMILSLQHCIWGSSDGLHAAAQGVMGLGKGSCAWTGFHFGSSTILYL